MPDPAPTVEQLLAMLVQRDEALAQRDAVIENLQARIVELERRLGQNSKNSSRPPSGDRMERSPSRAAQRRAGRKPGKQPGGPGSTLRRTESPDTVVEHGPVACGGFGADLDDAPVVKTRARQVVDIPEVSASVTEHRIHSRRCACGQVTDAPAPAGVSAPVQYGPNLRALATYLVVYQHVPVERAAELIGDVTGARPSTGWVSIVVAATSQQLVATDALIRTLLILALVLHVDETTVKVNGDRWRRAATTDSAGAGPCCHVSRDHLVEELLAIQRQAEDGDSQGDGAVERDRVAAQRVVDRSPASTGDSASVIASRAAVVAAARL